MSAPAITIALCTWNGAAHLERQLASYAAQTGVRWQLWVSDDGSTDDTRAILAEFARHHPVQVVTGPGRGAARNYLSLLCHPDLPAGPVALSDQDDIWHPAKLARALAHLDPGPGPAVYGAQSLHVRADGSPIAPSRPPRGPFGFANALVQNVISGHSAVLNADGLALVRAAGAGHDIPFHDWWLYQLVSGAGGRVHVDDAVVLDYRQHGSNMMGAHRGAAAAMSRAAMVLRNEYQAWIEANCAALETVSDQLTPEARRILTAYRGDTAAWGLPRAALVRRLGLHRQSRIGTGLLYLTAALGRI